MSIDIVMRGMLFSPQGYDVTFVAALKGNKLLLK